MSGFKIELKIVFLKGLKQDSFSFFCVSLPGIWLLLESYTSFAFGPNIESTLVVNMGKIVNMELKF